MTNNLKSKDINIEKAPSISMDIYKRKNTILKRKQTFKSIELPKKPENSIKSEEKIDENQKFKEEIEKLKEENEKYKEEHQTFSFKIAFHKHLFKKIIETIKETLELLINSKKNTEKTQILAINLQNLAIEKTLEIQRFHFTLNSPLYFFLSKALAKSSLFPMKTPSFFLQDFPY